VLDRLGSMRSKVLGLVVPFLAGASIVAAIATVVYLLTDGGDSTPARTPIPTNGPYPVLADGQYIDSLPHVNGLPSGQNAVPITYGASKTNSILIGTFEEQVETIIPTIGPGSPTPQSNRFRPLPWTTYRIKVEQWIKGGDGSTETTATLIGGTEGEEPRLFTGTFLPQIGRTYLFTLDLDTPDTPGTAKYVGVMAGWSAFEIGDGVIHVLDENNSRRLMGAYALMPLDQFVGLVNSWVIAPPSVTPTPPPSPSASP